MTDRTLDASSALLRRGIQGLGANKADAPISVAVGRHGTQLLLGPFFLIAAALLWAGVWFLIILLLRRCTGGGETARVRREALGRLQLRGGAGPLGLYAASGGTGSRRASDSPKSPAVGSMDAEGRANSRMLMEKYIERNNLSDEVLAGSKASSIDGHADAPSSQGHKPLLTVKGPADHYGVGQRGPSPLRQGSVPPLPSAPSGPRRSDAAQQDAEILASAPLLGYDGSSLSPRQQEQPLFPGPPPPQPYGVPLPRPSPYAPGHHRPYSVAAYPSAPHGPAAGHAHRYSQYRPPMPTPAELAAQQAQQAAYYSTVPSEVRARMLAAASDKAEQARIDAQRRKSLRHDRREHARSTSMESAHALGIAGAAGPSAGAFGQISSSHRSQGSIGVKSSGSRPQIRWSASANDRIGAPPPVPPMGPRMSLEQGGGAAGVKRTTSIGNGVRRSTSVGKRVNLQRSRSGKAIAPSASAGGAGQDALLHRVTSIPEAVEGQLIDDGAGSASPRLAQAPSLNFNGSFINAANPALSPPPAGPPPAQYGSLAGPRAAPLYNTAIGGAASRGSWSGAHAPAPYGAPPPRSSTLPPPPLSPSRASSAGSLQQLQPPLSPTSAARQLPPVPAQSQAQMQQARPALVIQMPGQLQPQPHAFRTPSGDGAAYGRRYQNAPAFAPGPPPPPHAPYQVPPPQPQQQQQQYYARPPPSPRQQQPQFFAPAPGSPYAQQQRPPAMQPPPSPTLTTAQLQALARGG